MTTTKIVVPEKDDVKNADEACKPGFMNESEVDINSFSASVLQNSNTNEHGNRKFDAEKVARIKAQIACGEYRINASRIVSKIVDNRT